MVTDMTGGDVRISVFLDIKEVQKTLKTVKNKINNLAKEGQVAFQGWALSVMFLGMAMKSAFDGIWRSATKVFGDVVHSVDGAVTGFDILKGSVTFLGFAVGQALEPVAMWLVPIIDKVANWVIENEKLASTLIITTGVLGTLFTFIGMGTLAFGGLLEMLIKSISVFKWVGTAITAIGSGPILIVTALIAAGVAMWLTNFAGFRDSLTSILGEVGESLTGTFGGLWQLITGLGQILKSFLTGDFDTFATGLKNAFWGLLKSLAGLADGITSLIMGTIKVVMQTSATLIGNLINIVLEGMARLLDSLSDLPFVGGMASKAASSLRGAGAFIQSDIAKDVSQMDDVFQRRSSLLELVQAMSPGMYQVPQETVINVSIDGTPLSQNAIDIIKSNT